MGKQSSLMRKGGCFGYRIERSKEEKVHVEIMAGADGNRTHRGRDTPPTGFEDLFFAIRPNDFNNLRA